MDLIDLPSTVNAEVYRCLNLSDFRALVETSRTTAAYVEQFTQILRSQVRHTVDFSTLTDILRQASHLIELDGITVDLTEETKTTPRQIRRWRRKVGPNGRLSRAWFDLHNVIERSGGHDGLSEMIIQLLRAFKGPYHNFVLDTPYQLMLISGTALVVPHRENSPEIWTVVNNYGPGITRIYGHYPMSSPNIKYVELSSDGIVPALTSTLGYLMDATQILQFDPQVHYIRSYLLTATWAPPYLVIALLKRVLTLRSDPQVKKTSSYVNLLYAITHGDVKAPGYLTAKYYKDVVLLQCSDHAPKDSNLLHLDTTVYDEYAIFRELFPDT